MFDPGIPHHHMYGSSQAAVAALAAFLCLSSWEGVCLEGGWTLWNIAAFWNLNKEMESARFTFWICVWQHDPHKHVQWSPLLPKPSLPCMISNRQTWTWLLCPEWRSRFLSQHAFQSMCDLEKMICFDLALKINTTTLERNFGQLCQQLSSHAGPSAQDGCLLSAVLHVALDGPKSSKGVFEAVKAEGGEACLSPTPFSLACGKLWLATYGRRFRCKYAKLPQSRSSSGKRKAPKGSFEMVKRMRAAAAHANFQFPGIHSQIRCSIHFDVAAQKQAMSGTRWQSEASSSAIAVAQGKKRKRLPNSLGNTRSENAQEPWSSICPIWNLFINLLVSFDYVWFAGFWAFTITHRAINCFIFYSFRFVFIRF